MSIEERLSRMIDLSESSGLTNGESVMLHTGVTYEELVVIIQCAAVRNGVSFSGQATRDALADAYLFGMHFTLDHMGRAPANKQDVLEVGNDGREVVINHPDLLTDANGNGYITFSPTQARALARLLMDQANQLEAGQ